ncbi:RNA polymerase sigma factor, sigma-70 family [Hyella patelloides LEGE 07179]|uniref:RNA polymerase sigma factor, sigma-70 family n=1 Tax=Hyella patelloides LEGE 07179 TaxID=945734 RepID=A0A563W2G3_9CYAN|nr:sigma-70 family RNA polymerase sigma factor [Hyella patelloides]VEP17856.1 RNA polymerase sigma factor, sigma-70 family [Hyella patelloides LEGE 07179]
MRPRQDIVEIFSTFIQFDLDRFSNWASDPRLRRSMNQCLKESPQEIAENFWGIYWHKKWSKNPKGLAREHLIAYLQEVCFWSTNKTITGFTSSQYNVPDCFQVAITGIDKVLKGFDGDRGYHLKSYATITFSNLIRELLRQRQEIDICSEWSLLRKLSQKRLIESLQNAGLSPDTVAQYVLAWSSFKTLYVPNRQSSTRKLNKPDEFTWKAIANWYNQERITQLNPPGEAVSTTILEQWLLSCVKAARSYLYPNVTSINQPKPGYESGEIVDSLVGDVEESLLNQMIVEEEVEQRNQQQNQIGDVLIQAIAKLPADERKLLELYYAQKLKQAAIAKALNTKQYNISRQLTRVKKSLLKSLAIWTEETLHISLTSDVIKNTSTIIDEWLEHHYNPNP